MADTQERDGVVFEEVQRTSLGAVTIRVHTVDGKKATLPGAPKDGKPTTINPIGMSGHDLDNAIANARAHVARQ